VQYSSKFCLLAVDFLQEVCEEYANIRLIAQLIGDECKQRTPIEFAFRVFGLSYTTFCSFCAISKAGGVFMGMYYMV